MRCSSPFLRPLLAASDWRYHAATARHTPPDGGDFPAGLARQPTRSGGLVHHSDRGSQYVSIRYSERLAEAGIKPSVGSIGDSYDNAFIESFNGKFRAECLNAHWFMSLDDAVRKCEAWRRDYNEVRPHSAIGNKPPITVMFASAANGPP